MKKIRFFVLCLAAIGLIAGASLATASGGSKVDMTGTWLLAVKTPDGSGTPSFTMKQEGDKLTGTYQGQFGTAPATGTVKGNDFQITYTLGGTTVVYKGKIEGPNKISGAVDFGGQGSGTFTGEKK